MPCAQSQVYEKRPFSVEEFDWPAPIPRQHHIQYLWDEPKHGLQDQPYSPTSLPNALEAEWEHVPAARLKGDKARWTGAQIL